MVRAGTVTPRGTVLPNRSNQEAFPLNGCLSLRLGILFGVA